MTYHCSPVEVVHLKHLRVQTFLDVLLEAERYLMAFTNSLLIRTGKRGSSEHRMACHIVHLSQKGSKCEAQGTLPSRMAGPTSLAGRGTT